MPAINPPPNTRIWFLGLVVALGALSWSLFSDFTAPWTDQIDANGACWSQSAHNTIRAGLLTTAGVPSAFYFGTLPIPPEGYYPHHPPLLSLMLAGMFRIFGEKEWVARLLPIAFSLLSTVLLWVLVTECVNARAATFCALALTSMPMELRYGRMVNFEPITLVWMLAGLLALFHWEKTGRRRWWWAACGALILALWTAWLGYLFVLVLCAYFLFSRRRRDVRLALVLLGASIVSLLLFLLEVHHVWPDAWRDMSLALNYRMGHSGDPVPWRDWLIRVGGLLLVHIHPVLWLLALAGVGVVWRAREDASGRWLAWGASVFFVMNALYVVAFRNASSIHDYASFYFIVPVAIMSGVALETASRWCEQRSPAARACGVIGIAVGLGALLVDGERKTGELRRPFSILTFDQPEPPELIPELGRAMRETFGKDVAVICNFLPVYGPQLHYYAQHDLLPCAFTAAEWKEQIADPENAPIGGVIWLEQPHAPEVLAILPPGIQTRRTIGRIPFCFWQPAEKGTAPAPQRGVGGG